MVIMGVLTMDSHPTIGTVGLTEAKAREKYGDAVKICQSLSFPSICHIDSNRADKSTFTALYYSMIEPEHKQPSLYKLVVVGKEERVVGVHILGLGSDEVLQGFAVAVKMGGS
jgi:glutathione reductase (NADPH)